MAKKGYYYNIVKEYIDREIDFVFDLIEETFTDYDHITECVYDTLANKVIYHNNEELDEIEENQYRKELFECIEKEYKEIIEKAIRIRNLFFIIAEDEIIMNNFNNNPYDLIEELTEASPERFEAYEYLFIPAKEG